MKPVKERLAEVRSALLGEIRDGIDPLEDVYTLIDSAIVEDPPFSVREGGMIKAGYNAEIDELRFEMTDGKGVIARVEAQEKERTGIKNLKVGYNRVFGYYIEISALTPARCRALHTQADPRQRRTVHHAGAQGLEARVLGAQDRVVALEYQLFTEVRTTVAEELHRIQGTARAIAQLDVLCSFAEVAVRRQYTRPLIDMKGGIEIKNGRHPVVESLQDSPFVPNDTLLDNHENRVIILTGPNMAGKSTYMRQTALIVLMAQIGCFVPAESATVGIVDRIFTRVGGIGRPVLRPVHLHGGDERGGLHPQKRHPGQSDRIRRDRPGHLHLRRHEHRPRGAGACGEPQKAGGQDPVRHPLS